MKTNRQMKKQGLSDGRTGRKQVYHEADGLTETEQELIDTYLFWYGIGKLEREGKI
jgi:hypothetical protein